MLVDIQVRLDRQYMGRPVAAPDIQVRLDRQYKDQWVVAVVVPLEAGVVQEVMLWNLWVVAVVVLLMVEAEPLVVVPLEAGVVQELPG